jgi:hypothetical protein
LLADNTADRKKDNNLKDRWLIVVVAGRKAHKFKISIPAISLQNTTSSFARLYSVSLIAFSYDSRCFKADSLNRDGTQSNVLPNNITRQ